MANHSKTAEPDRLPTTATLRRMIASGKSVPSKAVTK
jgi:hypothetical protein